MTTVGIELCRLPHSNFGNNLNPSMNTTLIDLIKYEYSATITYTTSELCYYSSHDMNTMLLEHTRLNYMLVDLT
jgi:hypothetical protein